MCPERSLIINTTFILFKFTSLNATSAVCCWGQGVSWRNTVERLFGGSHDLQIREMRFKVSSTKFMNKILCRYTWKIQTY